MENNEHAPIDIDELAASLRENLKTLRFRSKECCIYRVYHQIRCLDDESAFTPQVVSIGPLHHGKPQLRAGEEHKKRNLQHFLQRTLVTIEEFLRFIKDNELKILDSYAETIELQSKEFVEMVLIDAAFLIEHFFGYVQNYSIRAPLRVSISADLWMLENQLPFFVLVGLFNLAKTKTHGPFYDGLTLTKILNSRFESLSLVMHPEKLIETHFSEARHLLDLTRLCLQPSKKIPMPPNSQKKTIPPNSQNIPTVMELHQAGVKLEFEPDSNLLDITFQSDTLKIPLLQIHSSTEGLLRNLLAFEIMHCDTHHINDYVLVMNYLVNTPADVELLVQNGVVQNWLVDNGAVSTVFHNLREQVNLYFMDFQYSDLVHGLRDYSRYPWHKWKATLKQNYFNTPWASISVAAAVILLLLTLTQTICSIIALP